MGTPVGDQLEVTDAAIVCTHCDSELCGPSENVKEHLLVDEGGNEEAGPVYDDPSRFVDEDIVFRKFYCPNCGTMHFTETARAGEEILNEFQIAPGEER